MPTEFKNVSEITQQLINIVAANDELQDVWMQGKISNINRPRNGNTYFILKDNSKKIECVIFKDWEPLQENLPAAGRNISVKGEIYVYGTISEYRFKVTEIDLYKDSLQPQSVSVTALTEVLENTVANHTGEVQGQISDVYDSNAGWTNFKLKTSTDEAPSNIIECSLPPSIANNLPFTLTEGEEISVRGKFKIFSARNAYQIVINDTTHIKRVPLPSAGVLKSRCNECRQYHDANFELCATCHYAQVKHEGIVVGTVERYFKQFKNFSTQREYPIRFGRDIRGRGDVALLNSEGNPVVIAECKHIGYDGISGIDQLESYLNGSGSELGLFAGDTNPHEWTFFVKNRERNRLDEITCSEFEALITDQETPPLPKQPKRNPKSAPRLWQYITGVLGVALCICLTVMIMQLDEKNRQIRDNTIAISQIKNENQKLQEQITKKEEEIKNSPQTISQLTNENKTLESENQNLQEQITKKDIQIKDNARNILQLKNEIENLKEKLAEPGVQPSPIPNGKKTGPEPSPPKPIPALLNVNTASIEELQTLPGIGPEKARSIVEYREKNGKFASVEDITKIRGIAEKTLENLRKFISAE